MLEFYKTVGGRKFCDHTIPDLIRKLDKVAGLDFDGLTKAMNRLAKAQEEANQIAKRKLLFDQTEPPKDESKPISEEEKELVNFADRLFHEVSNSNDGLLIRDAPGAPKWASMLRNNQMVRDLLYAKGVNIEEDEDDETFTLTMKE